ncbi:MAG: LCP family protein [Chloroflexota bacterium]
MIKRIGLFVLRTIPVIIGAVIIVMLWQLAKAGMNDIVQRSNARGIYEQHSASFAGAATAIGQDNIQISIRMTEMPSPTASPTDSPDSFDSTGGSADTSDDNPTVITPIEASTNLGTTLSTPVLSDPATEAASAIEPSATITPTYTASLTATTPPTLTRVALAATLPPTNTKRAVVVPTQPPTATPTNIPATATTVPATATLPPTAIPPTATLPAVATQAATQPAAANPAAGPTLAATSKLPVVVLPGKRDEKPQVTAIPTNAPRVKANNNDIINILLIGSDADVDPSDPSFRTDSMVIVSINRTANSVSMLSVPRDLFVYIPSLGMQRINTAFQWGQAVKWSPGGGFGLLQQTILYNLGIPVHYYARISFDGFKQIINTYNGIDVAVDCPISDLRFQGKVDDKQTPVYEPFTLKVGAYKMDGSLALWYARMRHSTSDFDRNRRQQQILRAIWRTARDEGLLAKAPELWSQLTSIVDTNLPLQDAIGLVPIALNLKPSDITSYYMNKGYELQHWKTPAGEDVQLPDPKGFFQTINNFYTPPTGNRLGAQAATVEVVNGSVNQDWDKVAADHLTWVGFDVQDKGTGDKVDKTVIYDLTGNAKPGALATLLKSTNVKPGQVVNQPDPNRTTDFRIVLGNDYNSCTAPGFAK